MRNNTSNAAADGKEGKKKKQQQQQNEKNHNAMKREREIVVLGSSYSDSEEELIEGPEEEAKSSNNSNQNSNVAPKDEEEGESEEEEEKNDVKKNKTLSNGVAVSGCFPTHRIQRMIRSEGGFRVSVEAIFLINKATEKFLESLTEDAHSSSVQDRKKSMHYKHLASSVSKRKRYDFLSDFVPEKVRAEDALEERRLAGA